MSDHKLSRRGLLRLSALAGAGALLAACTPQVVKETVVVQQTVVVEKAKEVEKIVTAAPKPMEKVTLELWDWATDANDVNLAAVKASVDAFVEQESSHPGESWSTRPRSTRRCRSSWRRSPATRRRTSLTWICSPS